MFFGFFLMGDREQNISTITIPLLQEETGRSYPNPLGATQIKTNAQYYNSYVSFYYTSSSLFGFVV